MECMAWIVVAVHDRVLGSGSVVAGSRCGGAYVVGDTSLVSRMLHLHGPPCNTFYIL
jgi:hypothetical protein